MLIADVNLNEFNRRLAINANQLRLDSRRMMRKELAELVKTLVRISPPTDRNKSMRNVRAKVNQRFEKIGGQANNFDSSDIKEGNNGLKYWASNSKFLFAGAADSDMTKASANELRAVYYRMRKQSGSYRLVVPFLKPRRLQKVAISTRIITTKKQVKAVGDKIAKNFGRLKAGWLAPVIDGTVSGSGKFAIPKWVNEHRNGARSRFINNLDTPGHPSFTLINFAKGVTGKASKRFVNSALAIRAKAMAANAALILAGKKEYDY